MEHDGQLCSLFVFLVWQLGLRKHGQIGDQCLRRGWCLEVRDKTCPTMLSEISVLKSWPFYVWERKTGPISEETGLACCAVWTHNTQPFWRKNEEGDGKENPSRKSWCASPEGSLSMSPSLCGLWHTPWISLYFNLSPVLWSTFFSACASICIFLHTEWSTCLEIAESGLLEDQKKTERRKIEEHLINCEHVTSNSLLPWWAVATTASLSRE